MGNEDSKQISYSKLNELKEETNFSRGEIKEWYKKFHEDYPTGARDM